MFKRDGGRCVYCGDDLLATFSQYWSATVDHVLAVAADGGDGPENLVLCCPACNGMLSRAGDQKTFEERNSLVVRRREEERAGFEEWVRELRPQVEVEAVPT